MKLQKYLLLIALCMMPVYGMRKGMFPRCYAQSRQGDCARILESLKECSSTEYYYRPEVTLVVCKKPSGIELVFNDHDITYCKDIVKEFREALRE